MTNREKERLQKLADKLQRDINALTRQRNDLLEQASKADNFRSKSDAWCTVRFLERRIEKISRKQRKVTVKMNPPAKVKLLWEFEVGGGES